MFGKKKNDGDAPAEAKAPKKPAKVKAEKPKKKAKLNKGGPGFMASHIEKILFGIVAAGGAYFIYEGFNTPGYQETEPEAMKTDANRLITSISQDHWDQIKEQPERIVKSNYETRVDKARKPTDAAIYGPIITEEAIMSPTEKRGDPEILPPEKLHVANVAAALAIEVRKDLVDPFESWEDAEKIESRRSRRNRGSSGPAAGGGYGGEGGGPGLGGGGYGGEGGFGGGPGMGGGVGAGAEPPARRLTSKYDQGAPVIDGSALASAAGGYGGGGYGGEGMGGPGMGGGYGGEGMGGPGMGSGPGMGGATGGQGGGLRGSNSRDARTTKLGSRGVFFNSITALVPHRKMADSYKEAFENTGAIIASRDKPVYMGFELQRVDVTGNPTRDVKEEEWKTISNHEEQYRYPWTQKWAARLPNRNDPKDEAPLSRPLGDVVNRANRAPLITMAIPPVLLRSYHHFAKHPDIDWTWGYTPDRKKIETPKLDDDADTSPALPPPGGGGPATGMGGMGSGYGGGMGPGMGGPGMGGGYGGEGGGYGGEGMGGPGMGGPGMGGGYGGEGGGYGDGGYGGPGMGGGFGMGGGMSGRSIILEPEFKMIRCYDMLSGREVGRMYRYRVRTIMQDPNYPASERIPEPNANQLQDEVWERVAAIRAADDARIEQDENATRTSLRSAWSEPSAPTLVQYPVEAFAGEVTYPSAKYVDDKVAVRSGREASATVVATLFSPQTGARYAGEFKNVRRGSVLNNKIDAEVIVPTSRIIKLKEDYQLMTGSFVADIHGGSELEAYRRDDPMRSTGEMLIVHPYGHVQITNDVDDLFLYRMYNFTDEKEAAENANSAPDAGAGGMGPGMGGGGGYGAG